MIRRPVVAALAAASALARPPAAHSAVNVVATTSSMGMLARTVGGDAVKVTVLSPPDRDAHYLLAKPSMMVALRRADLLVAVGAELEVGWLPAAIQGATNPRILPGQPGYFEGAAQVELIEVGQAADRAKGDVHPKGNPHYYMDPERMAARREGAGRAAWRRSTRRTRRGSSRTPTAFAQGGRRARAGVEAAAPAAPRERSSTTRTRTTWRTCSDVPILGYVEPLPGIPPTAAHLQGLVRSLAGQEGRDPLQHVPVGRRADVPAPATSAGRPQQLQLEVDLGADGKGYLDHVDRWVTAIASGQAMSDALLEIDDLVAGYARARRGTGLLLGRARGDRRAGRPQRGRQVHDPRRRSSARPGSSRARSGAGEGTRVATQAQVPSRLPRDADHRRRAAAHHGSGPPRDASPGAAPPRPAPRPAERRAVPAPQRLGLPRLPGPTSSSSTSRRTTWT